MSKELKKYIAKFKVYNGEATYNIPVGVEAKTRKEAEKYFNDYVCETEIEIWKLLVFEEVKDFEDLWEWVR